MNPLIGTDVRLNIAAYPAIVPGELDDRRTSVIGPATRTAGEGDRRTGAGRDGARAEPLDV
jgi:hypothetical protein